MACTQPRTQFVSGLHGSALLTCCMKVSCTFGQIGKTGLMTGWPGKGQSESRHVIILELLILINADYCKFVNVAKCTGLKYCVYLLADIVDPAPPKPAKIMSAKPDAKIFTHSKPAQVCFLVGMLVMVGN